MYAGVPSMVVSLWQVNDASTASIMQLFYQNLHKGRTKSEALRQAKLTFIEKAKGILNHPAFWAPFIQLGDDRPIYITTKTNYWPWAIGGGVLCLLLVGMYWLRLRKR